MKKFAFLVILLIAFFSASSFFSTNGAQFENEDTLSTRFPLERENTLYFEDPDGGGVTGTRYTINGHISYLHTSGNTYPARGVKVNLLIHNYTNNQYYQYNTFTDDLGNYSFLTQTMTPLLQNQYFALLKVSLDSFHYGVYNTSNSSGNLIKPELVLQLTNNNLDLSSILSYLINGGSILNIDLSPSTDIVYAHYDYINLSNTSVASKSIHFDNSPSLADFKDALNIHQSLNIGFEYLEEITPGYSYDYLKVYYPFEFSHVSLRIVGANPLNILNQLLNSYNLLVGLTIDYVLDFLGLNDLVITITYADLVSLLGSTLPFTSFYYPEEIAFYFENNGDVYAQDSVQAINGGNTIFIDKGDWNSRDTVLHEMGHYVAYQYEITKGVGASHSSSNNQINEFGKYYGSMLAWSEAFANFYSKASQEYVKLNNFYPAMTHSNLNISGYNIETHSISSTSRGEGNYRALSMFLWDIVDQVIEGLHDTFGLGDAAFFSLIDNMNPSATFTDFYKQLSISKTDTQYGLLMEYYGLAPKHNTPSSSSTATTTPQFFSWIAPNDGTSLTKTYYLELYGPSGQLLISKYVGTNTGFSLSASEWSYILHQQYTHIFWRIGFRNSGSPTTGTYYSSARRLNMPLPTLVSEHILYSRYLSYATIEWFKFKPVLSGNYLIYTSGTVDTYGEVFHSIISSTSTVTPIAYNDNSGSENNFQINVYLNANQFYYIRVRGATPTSIGSYNLRISPLTNPGGTVSIN